MKTIAGMLVAATITMGFIFAGDEKPAKKKVTGVDRTAMDTTVSPAVDFYTFANGSWIRNNPIPSTEGRWGSFNELAEKNNQILKAVLEEAAGNPGTAGTVRYKLGTYYSIAMDTVKLEKQGIEPLKPVLEKIKALKGASDLPTVFAELHSKGISPGFSFSVDQDARQNDVYAIYLSQPGLGLPDKDYYTRTDQKSIDIRDAYKAHQVKMFELAGETSSSAVSNGAKVFELENILASASMNRLELRDFEKQYHKVAYQEFKSKHPAFNWDLYFQKAGVAIPKEIIVTQPEYFKKFNDLLTRHPFDSWKSYFQWSVINESASHLYSALDKQNFSFYSTTLNGVKEMKPRWKRALNGINGVMGEALGQLYVEKAFSAESKQKVNEMVDNLILAFRDRINGLDWMSDATKKKALEKLASFDRKLGYPDKWIDYSSLQVSNDSYLQNYWNGVNFGFRRMINKLGQPVDKTEWMMPPQTVNAYYNPLRNEIVFPAAIMQPPFFYPEADDAVNYGCMGAVIGHELTHGFDDEGAKFDAKGNMVDWWTEEDTKKFQEKTALLVKQFNAFKPLDDINVNGELTLGENIADLGGLAIAFDAYQRSLKGTKGEIIDGFTPEQRFFIGWSQVWKENTRPESARQLVHTDPHSPAIFRVLGPLPNLPQFYEAFKIKEGDKMFRPVAERAKVW